MNFAGFWIRFLAHWVDFVFWNALEYALETAITQGMHLSPIAEQGVGVFLTLLIAYLYYVEVPIRYGTTPGKRIFRIRVWRQSGLGAPGRKQLLLRLVGYVFSYATLGCGFLMVMFHPQKLGLHDLIAGTASLRGKKNPPSGGELQIPELT